MAEELKPTTEYVDVLSGQVVLTVSRARDLPAVDSGGTSDPYVIARLETPQGKSEKMKTKVITKNLNPEWNETFTFTTSDISHSMFYFQVWDWNRVRDEELGKAVLDLRTLTQYNTCLEFPIQLQNGVTSQGTLVVQVTFTPQATLDDNRKPKGKKIPNFRLELTKVDYLPGEPVTGFLVYNATKERKIRNIRLDFVGKEHVYWTERHGKFTYVYTQTILHIDQRVIMIGKEKEKMALQAQFYRFPFTFHLPTNAPPTLHKTVGNIWYTLKGTVDIPMAIDKTTNFEITVHRPVHNIIRSLPNVRDEYVNDKVEGLKLKVSVNKRTYMLGEVIQLEFVVENKSSHKIDEINVKLKQAEEYQATTKTRYHKHTPFSGKINKDVLPIRPGAVWDYGFSLAIPVEHIVPSYDHSVTSIIFMLHFVSITFHYGTLKKTKVRVPITLLEPLTANFPQYDNTSASK